MILRQKPDNVDWMTSKKEKIKRGKPSLLEEKEKVVDEGTRAEKRGKISRNEENTFGPNTLGRFLNAVHCLIAVAFSDEW